MVVDDVAAKVLLEEVRGEVLEEEVAFLVLRAADKVELVGEGGSQ